MMRLSIFLLALGFCNPALATVRETCSERVGAAKATDHLQGLPAEIRADIEKIFPKIGDGKAVLLETDAPRRQERDLPTAKFVQAFLVKSEWFVEIKISMRPGVTTFGYVAQPSGAFRRWPSHYFAGPSCEAVRAAVSGVITPGGFNF